MSTDLRQFPSDRQRRAELFPEREHPAKANLFLLEELVERYTRPGDLVLDPMAGVGSLLIAAALGRRVLLFELEAPYAAAARRNAAARDVPLFVARANAMALPLPNHCIDAVVTSPPYGDLATRKRSQEASTTRRASIPDWARRRHDASFHVDTYGKSWMQLGNLTYPRYLMATLQVYAECARVLKDGGKLVTITADCWRQNRRRPLGHDTALICQAVGLKPSDHWQRDRSRALTAWQYLRRTQGKEVITVEDVQVFERP